MKALTISSYVFIKIFYLILIFMMAISLDATRREFVIFTISILFIFETIVTIPLFEEMTKIAPDKQEKSK